MKLLVVFSVIVSLLSLLVSGYVAYQTRLTPDSSQSIGLLSESKPSANIAPSTTSVDNDQCGDLCRIAIKKEVESLEASLSAKLLGVQATKNVSYQPTTTNVPTTSYISLSGEYSTSETEWVTLDSSAATLDLVNDYGALAKAYFSVSLKAQYEGGKAFVRLYDETHNIVVEGSEMVSQDNVFVVKESSNLPIWKGKNTYVLQIKSLDARPVYATNARIKVVN
jgi:hypothetical protein